MGTLRDLGHRHKTDKVDVHHTFKGETYMEVYAKYFEPIRDKPISILEIGIKKGASLRVWEDYFTHPQSVVVGIDIAPAPVFERAHAVIGDQANPTVLEKAIAHANGRKFDIVIDDGSHINRLTLASQRYLWPHLKSGGYYVLEDMKCTYLGDGLVSEMRRGGWKYDYVPESETNDRSTIDRLLLKTVREMDHLRGDVRAIHMHPMTYVIEKV